MEQIKIQFFEGEVGGEGQRLLNAARGQSAVLAALLTPERKTGKIEAVIWDGESPEGEHILGVWCKSKLTRSQRMRKFGVENLPKEYEAGRSELGTREAIPNEDYIVKCIAEHGDEPARRFWTIPDSLLEAVQANNLNGAGIIQAMGIMLGLTCQTADFEVE